MKEVSLPKEPSVRKRQSMADEVVTFETALKNAKGIRELTMMGIDTILTSTEGEDKNGDTIVNLSLIERKATSLGQWIPKADVVALQTQLQELMKTRPSWKWLSKNLDKIEEVELFFRKLERFVGCVEAKER